MLEEIVKFRNHLNSLLGKPTINVQDLIKRIDKIIGIGTRQYLVYVDYDGRTDIWFVSAAVDEEHAILKVRALVPVTSVCKAKEKTGDHPWYLGSINKEA